MPDASASSPSFQPTRWSLIACLRGGEPAAQARAAEELARVYWGAIKTTLRRRGASESVAEECTQAFFAGVVLPRKLLEGADPGRGRLRTLLLTALQNFQIDEARRARAQKHGGGVKHLEIGAGDDGAGASLGCGDDASAWAGTFDAEWRRAQVQEALRRTREHYAATGQTRLWNVFEQRELRPLLGPVNKAPLAEAAGALGFKSPADAAQAAQTVRRLFEGHLRQVVQESCTSAEECAEELAALGR